MGLNLVSDSFCLIRISKHFCKIQNILLDFNWNVKTFMKKLFGAVPNVIVDSMSVSIVGKRKHIL